MIAPMMIGNRMAAIIRANSLGDTQSFGIFDISFHFPNIEFGTANQ